MFFKQEGIGGVCRVLPFSMFTSCSLRGQNFRPAKPAETGPHFCPFLDQPALGGESAGSDAVWLSLASHRFCKAGTSAQTPESWAGVRGRSSLPSSSVNPTIIQSLAETLLLAEIVCGILLSVSPLTNIIVIYFTSTCKALPVRCFNCFTSIRSFSFPDNHIK